jgi:hypothetical protein
MSSPSACDFAGEVKVTEEMDSAQRASTESSENIYRDLVIKLNDDSCSFYEYLYLSRDIIIIFKKKRNNT